ncbi:65-kDa microtubule-associated protein 1 [Cryptomeria japonica]|uniref:65-kDa microtubule-associated protein 1 n=1 Tax=Cryptomeria japonica TaxID=3369 RepID=UPI0025ACBF86|nr:65-kDa microtubule-associated protein 1 [Cryptomeria japonica]XP_057829014.1 65-kDa microtubule-associated protein 1 [Cryptomeria japonica]
MTEMQNPLIVDGKSCGSLLQELQQIWDEVGESDAERDMMLLQLEQDCLDVYKRKVDEASQSRAQLLQTLEDSRAELTNLLSALGEHSFPGLPEKPTGTLKEQLSAITPVLEKLWQQKEERIKQFLDIQVQIQRICGEIAGKLQLNEPTATPKVDDQDLSMKRLDEFHFRFQELQREKNDRLHKVLDYVSTVHDLCAVLGIDFFSIVMEVHPTLSDSVSIQSKSISNDTLAKLANTVQSLKEEKKQRLQKLQELGTSLTELWNLMDTPVDERRLFDHMTCNIAASVDEVTVPGALAIDIIEQAEVEVERLDQLKSSKMKELALKKQVELEEIYRRAHMEVDSESAQEKLMALVDSGNIDPSELLASMEEQICKAKEEALSRKEIMEKVEKWMSACEEESWLEDYNKDDNRYNSSRGAHLNLKRAERARVLVNKIPALVDTLIAKTRSWEDERKTTFLYDGVPLLAMLDEYTVLRQEREEEKRRFRDQKRFHEQLTTEQESLFGSRPSPSRQLSSKKGAASRTNGSSANGTPLNRRLSLGGQQVGTNGVTPVRQGMSASKEGKREHSRPGALVNYVALAKEDSISQVSENESALSSP